MILQNYYEMFIKDFLMKVLNEKVDNLKKIEDLNNNLDISIEVLKVHYRKVNDLNMVNELNYKYNDIVCMFDYKKGINLNDVFTLTIDRLNNYGINNDYQSEKKELRYWSEEKGILTLHTNLKSLLRMYESEKQNFSNNEKVK